MLAEDSVLLREGLVRLFDEAGFETVGAFGDADSLLAEIEELQPDTLVVYSTRWLAVLDQQWQGRARISGLHVDDNWHEHGEMRYDLMTDVSLARACVKAANRAGVHSKLVDYAGFPLDSARCRSTHSSTPMAPFRP